MKTLYSRSEKRTLRALRGVEGRWPYELYLIINANLLGKVAARLTKKDDFWLVSILEPEKISNIPIESFEKLLTFFDNNPIKKVIPFSKFNKFLEDFSKRNLIDHILRSKYLCRNEVNETFRLITKHREGWFDVEMDKDGSIVPDSLPIDALFRDPKEVEIEVISPQRAFMRQYLLGLQGGVNED